MGRFVDFAFNEDLDLNAAPAQLAALKEMRAGITLEDADTIRLPNIPGMWLQAIRWMDETAGGTGGYLHFPGKGSDRKYRFGKTTLLGDLLVGEILFAPNEFPLSPHQKIKAFGDDSGSGAEQHAIIGTFWHPTLPPIPNGLGVALPEKAHVHRLGLKTGTLTAQTPSGLSSVLGDGTAFEDSEIEFGTTAKNQYMLRSIGNYPGLAGVGICGVRSPDGLSDRYFPSIIASAVKGIDFEIGWLFNGDAGPKLLGAGAVTTSTEWTEEIVEMPSS